MTAVPNFSLSNTSLSKISTFPVHKFKLEDENIGSTEDTIKLRVYGTNGLTNGFVLKHRYDDSDYILYKEILEPFALNSPRIYGYIWISDKRYFIMEEIPHVGHDENNEASYFRMIDWLIRKDQISMQNLDQFKLVTYIRDAKGYDLKDWLPEIEFACKNSSHPMFTIDFWNLLSENKNKFENFILELDKTSKTLVHGDININNILFLENHSSNKYYIIDWTNPHIGSYLYDLLTIIMNSPKNIQSNLLVLYSAKRNIAISENLLLKTKLIKLLSKISWVALLKNKKSNFLTDDDALTKEIHEEIPSLLKNTT